MRFKYVIVGAGLAGIVMAERIASQLNEKVLVIEKRNHIGGNVYDSYNQDGILVHNYGPHTFHTDNKRVFDYMLNFTEWNYYQHRVLSYVDGNFVPFPISLETINKLYNLSLSENEIDDFIASKKVSISDIKTSEDVALSQVGVEIYEKFFKYYTIKQWGVSADKLDKSVISRIPFRKNRDTRYFDDQYQGLPKHGYTKMCENMLSNSNIKIMLNTDFKELKNSLNYEKLIYTGSIDDYFDYKYGKLKYRSLDFKFETYDMDEYQPAPSTRYPKDYDFTRITEFKKMTGQRHHKTTILKEYPCFGDEPYYPYPDNESKELYLKYKDLADKDRETIFIGRLAEYKYYDMDDVISKALEVFESIKN